ncbi:contactin-4-like [Dendronephthya gigantea]|uniref:contactin-4-like n=1 Tax=Dendronephthya gigantea TaxID=151771 RepID=UPI00106ADBD5|nr:contactin-4-like [Dendronephthya gigantea]
MKTKTIDYLGAIRPPSGTDLKLFPHILNNEIKWTFDGKASIRTWFFPAKPNVTFSCSDTTTLNEGDDFSRLCEVEPRKPELTFTSNPAPLGGSVTISCSSDGVPEPSYKITHNGTKVSTKKSFTISPVKWRDAGTYECFVKNNLGSDSVSKYLTEKAKPNVTLGCPDTTTLNEGDDFSCLCEGKDGNPPADVTWFKDDKKISGTGKNERLLTFTNIDNTDSGNYKCVAESDPDERYKDEKTIEITIHFRPHVTTITFMPKRAEVGKAMNITCESEGLPEPSFIITHNNTEIIVEKTYNIPQVNWSDGGLYQCIARNILGSNSKCYFLTVSGAIRPPSGTDLMLLPHKLNNEIKWTFDGKAYQRVWLFTRRGDTARKTIATISVAGDITIFNKSLPGVSVISPATLVLKKVDKDFNGKYEFRLTLDDGSVIVSYVSVFIAEKPTVKLNCSNTTTLNEGDDFSCLCEGKDGNPPANVTWFKDDTKIGGTGKKEQMLTLKNVDNTDRGTYKCLAESHPDERYEDKKTVKIIVHFRPHVTTITFMAKKAKVGKAITSHVNQKVFLNQVFITHNNTEVIAEKTYNIPQVK